MLSILTLLIHHKIKHSNPDDLNNFVQDPRDQWFQCGIYPNGDVCNCTTLSHEMVILFLVFVMLICIGVMIMLKCIGFPEY